MTVVLRLLLVALVLGPQLGEIRLPLDLACDETETCCPPEESCTPDCQLCACCAGRTVGFTAAPAVALLDSPRAPAAPVAVTPPTSPPPGDILHVPKAL